MKGDTVGLLPLYAQIERILAASIGAGTPRPGDRLPPEHSLIARRFDRASRTWPAAGWSTARLVDKLVMLATKTVAEQLAMAEGTPVVRIQHVRMGDGKPVSFDETYLPLEIGKKIMANDLAVEPIFALLEEKYDLQPMTGWKRHTPMISSRGRYT